jgi:nucleoid-associated protein YgaU
MKMDPALKVAMVLCVLLGGFCAAKMFRRSPPRPVSPTPAAAEQVRTHSPQNVPAPIAQPQEASPCVPAESVAPPASISQRPATVVKPLGRMVSPPPLAPKYPETNRTVGSHWGPSMEMMLPTNRAATTHRIVDGDTLEGLAQRYLGSPARAREIFDANRNVLTNPRLLPIGVELKIPSTDAQPSRPQAR